MKRNKKSSGSRNFLSSEPSKPSSFGGRSHKNLWLAGGAVVLLLVIIMAVLARGQKDVMLYAQATPSAPALHPDPAAPPQAYQNPPAPLPPAQQHTAVAAAPAVRTSSSNPPPATYTLQEKPATKRQAPPPHRGIVKYVQTGPHSYKIIREEEPAPSPRPHPTVKPQPQPRPTVEVQTHTAAPKATKLSAQARQLHYNLSEFNRLLCYGVIGPHEASLARRFFGTLGVTDRLPPNSLSRRFYYAFQRQLQQGGTLTINRRNNQVLVRNAALEIIIRFQPGTRCPWQAQVRLQDQSQQFDFQILLFDYNKIRGENIVSHALDCKTQKAYSLTYKAQRLLIANWRKILNTSP